MHREELYLHYSIFLNLNIKHYWLVLLKNKDTLVRIKFFPMRGGISVSLQ